MKYYLLIYHVVEDYIERRATFREEHLRLAGEAFKRGDLILGGALTEPTDKAVLIFHCRDRAVIEEFIRQDPYVLNGLVPKWEIRDWNVVIG